MTTREEFLADLRHYRLSMESGSSDTATRVLEKGCGKEPFNEEDYVETVHCKVCGELTQDCGGPPAHAES